MIILIFTLVFSAHASYRDHFFISRDSNKSDVFHPTILEDCRKKISKVMCLVNKDPDETPPSERKCLPGGEKYATFFEDIFDHYPIVLKKVFCSIDYIFVEKEFYGSAYGGIIEDDNGNTKGAQIGIRKSLLDQQLNLKLWSSWKEQLSFGGILDSYTLSPQLPSVETHTKVATNDFIYFVMAHEFGHILDFANNLTKTKDCDITDEAQECNMVRGGWGSISWKTDKKAKDINEFKLRKKLCFYMCEENYVEEKNIAQVYQDILKTDFISLYATTEPWDDFADSLAYFVMSKELKTTYVIDTKKDLKIDVMKRLKSTKWKRKFDYLNNLLKRTDLIYP